MGNKILTEEEFEVEGNEVIHQPTSATWTPIRIGENLTWIDKVCSAAFCRTVTTTVNMQRRSHYGYFASD